MGSREASPANDAFCVDFSKLDALAARHAPGYASGRPFPHACIDDFLRPEAAQAIARAIPEPGKGTQWDFYFAKGLEEKWALSDYLALPAPARELVATFNSGPFVRFLEQLTGIDHLLPDPHLHGGGLHQVKRGGVLQVHSDFNWSERLQAHRRVNLFVYFNPGWREEWGGALELWDGQAQRCEASYLPLFNRLIVFTARSDTFHGHPHPLACPEGVWRKSLALYYYTAERPPEERRDAHGTLFKGRDA